MPVESELGRGCDWATTAGSILGVPIGPVVAPPRTCHPRLEFAAFSVKSMVMTARGNGFGEHGQAGWSFPALALAVALVWLLPASPSAQMFQDRPPPVPPASVPDAPSGPALNLAPPSGAGAIPTFSGPLNHTTIVQPLLGPVQPVDPALSRVAAARHGPAGGAAAGRPDREPGGAVADGALRQGSAGHQWRAGMAGVPPPTPPETAGVTRCPGG